MGRINQYANLYKLSGEIIEKAPIKSKVKQFPPRQTKYPGGNLAPNIFR